MQALKFYFVVAKGFLNTSMTESPRMNIFAMYLSLLIGLAFFVFEDLGVSVQSSLTFSSTILQCLSKAFTLPKSFLLFRQFIRTWVLFLTDCIRTDRGPVLNSSSSLFANSSGVISDFGLFKSLPKREQWSNNWYKLNFYPIWPFFFLFTFIKVGASNSCWIYQLSLSSL